MKVKNLCSSKENKREATDWEIIFARHIYEKDLPSEYIKNTLNSIIR